MKDVLPLFLAPTTRTLQSMSQCLIAICEDVMLTHLNGVGSFRLRILRGLLTLTGTVELAYE